MAKEELIEKFIRKETTKLLEKWIEVGDIIRKKKEECETMAHKTIPVLVWVDIDEGAVDLVNYLNTLPGIRTLSSCQGGHKSKTGRIEKLYVCCGCSNEESYNKLIQEFDCEILGEDTTNSYKCSIKVSPKEKEN